MFGLTIITKKYLEELEDYCDYAEKNICTNNRKLIKIESVLKRIKNDSKKMNKNEIVDLCNNLFKELK